MSYLPEGKEDKQIKVQLTSQERRRGYKMEPSQCRSLGTKESCEQKWLHIQHTCNDDG